MKGVWVFFRLDNHLRVQRNSSVSSERWRWIFLRHRSTWLHVMRSGTGSIARTVVGCSRSRSPRSDRRFDSHTHTHTKKIQEHETCVVRK